MRELLPRRKSEVDKRNFGGRFWRVMWIGKFGRYVELEVLVVRNDGIAKFDHKTSLLPESLLMQNQTNKRLR